MGSRRTHPHPEWTSASKHVLTHRHQRYAPSGDGIPICYPRAIRESAHASNAESISVTSHNVAVSLIRPPRMCPGGWCPIFSTSRHVLCDAAAPYCRTVCSSICAVAWADASGYRRALHPTLPAALLMRPALPTPPRSRDDTAHARGTSAASARRESEPPAPGAADTQTPLSLGRAGRRWRAAPHNM